MRQTGSHNPLRKRKLQKPKPRAEIRPLALLARDLPGSATVWLKAGMPQTDLRGASAVKF
ncbi:hypothetical protein DRA43_13765 [Micromonospora provocatoris]|nr:hypothetical protein DRA43_13765 [Micromonospora provocatoris]